MLIPAETLSLGTYIFTLTLSYNETVSTAETIVEVVAEPVPLLSIAVSCCGSPHPVNANLSLIAVVYSESPALIQWTVDLIPGKYMNTDWGRGTYNLTDNLRS